MNIYKKILANVLLFVMIVIILTAWIFFLPRLYSCALCKSDKGYLNIYKHESSIGIVNLNTYFAVSLRIPPDIPAQSESSFGSSTTINSQEGLLWCINPYQKNNSCRIDINQNDWNIDLKKSKQNLCKDCYRQISQLDNETLNIALINFQTRKFYPLKTEMLDNFEGYHVEVGELTKHNQITITVQSIK